jgi:hypothetical protein
MRDLFRIGPLVVKFDPSPKPFPGVKFCQDLFKRLCQVARRPWCTHWRHEWIEHERHWTYSCAACGGHTIGGESVKLEYLPKVNWKKYDWAAYNKRHSPKS